MRVLVAASAVLSDTTPTPPAGHSNVAWQTDGLNLSGHVPTGGGGVTGSADQFGVTIDGGGSAVTTGSKGFIQLNYAGTITGWTILADQAGYIEFDVLKASYSGFPTTASIVAAAPPRIGTASPLTTAQKASSSSLTGWTATFAAGDVFEFSVVAAGTLTRATLILEVTRA